MKTFYPLGVLALAVFFSAVACCGSCLPPASPTDARSLGTPSEEAALLPAFTSAPQTTPLANTATPAEEEQPPLESAAPPTPSPKLNARTHWQAGAAVQLDSISMINTVHGWGISGQYVLTTADAGKTWKEVTPPEDLAAGTAAQAYGAFLDQQNGWAVLSQAGQIVPEASVWRTTDGGRTWARSTPLFHTAHGETVWAEFAMRDAQHAWLMVRGVYVGAGTHHSHELFRTTDGGLTWAPLESETSDDYTGLVFADNKNGILTWQTTGAYAAGPPEYAVTADGGAQWEHRTLPAPPDAAGLFEQYPYCESYQPVMLSAHSIRLLMGCFDYGYPPKAFASYFYASDDGGAIWRMTKLPAKVMASQDQLIYMGSGGGLLLGREIYQTLDDGRGWGFIQNVSWDGKFSFVDALNGWAVVHADGKVALVRTSNAGYDWAEIKPVVAK
jgi:photosystem II stability/assembly factor-like uncharacterized protein